MKYKRYLFLLLALVLISQGIRYFVEEHEFPRLATLLVEQSVTSRQQGVFEDALETGYILNCLASEYKKLTGAFPEYPVFTALASEAFRSGPSYDIRGHRQGITTNFGDSKAWFFDPTTCEVSINGTNTIQSPGFTLFREDELAFYPSIRLKTGSLKLGMSIRNFALRKPELLNMCSNHVVMKKGHK